PRTASGRRPGPRPPAPPPSSSPPACTMQLPPPEEGAMREMKAAELMTPDPITVERGTTISDVARELREHDLRLVPIVESHGDRRLLGVITDRDVAVRCVAAGHEPHQCAVDQHMTRDVRAVQAGDDVATVMDVMKSERVRRVPVVDAKNRV